MSLVAGFRLVPIAAVPRLVEAAAQSARTYADQLREDAGREVTFPGSGGLLATALAYLQQHGVPIMESGFAGAANELSKLTGKTQVILTAAQRDACFDAINVAPDRESELRDYFNDFNAANEPDVGRAMLDGLRAIREVLVQVSEKNVVLLTIG
jgi:hypothetical protein